MQLETRPPPGPRLRHVSKRRHVTFRYPGAGFGPLRERRKEKVGQGGVRQRGGGVQFSAAWWAETRFCPSRPRPGRWTRFHVSKLKGWLQEASFTCRVFGNPLTSRKPTGASSFFASIVHNGLIPRTMAVGRILWALRSTDLSILCIIMGLSSPSRWFSSTSCSAGQRSGRNLWSLEVGRCEGNCKGSYGKSQ